MGLKFKKAGGGKTPAGKYVLPTSASEPKRNIEDFSFWFFGRPKVGKTTLAEQFKLGGKPPIHIFAEPGGKAISNFQVLIRKWNDAPKYLELIEQSDRFGAAVVDTVEALYQHSWNYQQKTMGWDHPSDLGYGKGWSAVKEPVLRFLDRVLGMPDKGAILISHAKTGTRSTADGDEVEDIHPNLSGAMLEDVAGMVDVIGYYFRSRGQNWLRIRPADNIMAGCRLEENFRFSDGSPVDVIPMGNSKEVAYQNLIAAFNNELDRPEPEKKKKLLKKKAKA